MRTEVWASGFLVFAGLLAMAQNKTSDRASAKAPNHVGVRIFAVSTCPSDPVLAADGTANGPDFINASTTNYYSLNFKSGHSYAAEVWDPFDPTNSSVPQLSLLSGCSTGPSFTDVANYDPDITGGFSDRISWIQPADATEELAMLNPDTVNGYTYMVRVTDTTLHNPRWSTFSGFITQYGFQNNSNLDITGTLTATDSTGPVHTLNVTVPAGKMVLRIIGPSGDIAIPAGHLGSSTFAFVGPAGAITADSYFINGNATVIVPGLFVPKNLEH